LSHFAEDIIFIWLRNAWEVVDAGVLIPAASNDHRLWIPSF
jgi:hypothetical protein